MLTQHQVAELQRQFDLIRLSCTSLVRTHGRAVQLCKQNQERLTGDTLVDGMYTHREVRSLCEGGGGEWTDGQTERRCVDFM